MGREWLTLSPRCKPGSLAHLFRSFAKHAFSAGIFLFLFSLFYSFFPLFFVLTGRINGRKVIWTISCIGLSCISLFHARGGVFFKFFFWQGILGQNTANGSQSGCPLGGKPRYHGKDKPVCEKSWTLPDHRMRHLAEYGINGGSGMPDMAAITRLVRKGGRPLLGKGIRKRDIENV